MAQRQQQSVNDSQIYDAVSLLGFGVARQIILPDGMEKPSGPEMVVRYGGWTARELFVACMDFMQDPFACESSMPWLDQRLPEGLYFVAPAFPTFASKTFDHQKRLSGTLRMPPAPTVIVATALICNACLNGKNTLLNDLKDMGVHGCTRVRCMENVGSGNAHAVLWWAHEKLRLDLVPDDHAKGNLHMAVTYCDFTPE